MPWFKFNAAQFLTDTAHLTDAEVGLHVRMLALFWHHGSVPNDPGWVRARCPNAGSPRDLKALDGLWEVEANAKQNLTPVALEGERPRSEEIREKRVLAGKKGGLASGEARREASASSTCRTQNQIQNQKKNQNPPTPRAPFDLDGALKGSVLDTPRFRSAWVEYEGHRGDMPARDRLTDRARAMSLKKLADLGEADAVKALETAVAKGWKGVVFERPKVNGKTNGHVQASVAPPGASNVAAYRPWRENLSH